MTTEQQNLAWACLPEEVRHKMSTYFKQLLEQYKDYESLNFRNASAKVKERIVTLDYFFGKHNLTSDTEPEDMLCVNKKSFVNFQKLLDHNYNYDSEMYDDLYWEFAKCLPEVLNTPNSGELKLKTVNNKPFPKFNIGDTVDFYGNICKIIDTDSRDRLPYCIVVNGCTRWVAESDLTAYP